MLISLNNHTGLMATLSDSTGLERHGQGSGVGTVWGNAWKKGRWARIACQAGYLPTVLHHFFSFVEMRAGRS